MNGRWHFVAFRSSVMAIALVGAALAHLARGEIKVIEVLGGLIGAAGVVVTVFGIWIAIIYPRYVTSLESGAKPSNIEDAGRYKVLMTSLFRSAFTLVLSLFLLIVIGVFGVASPLLPAPFFFFSMMALVSIGESLMASIASGDSSAAKSLDEGAMKGARTRRRHGSKHARRTS
ncbi:hypothetical protein IAE60_00910 [Pseudoxanthomonas mexicana]|uniref:Uncharacterized protein n=1 Tax=Pseudoxanthomonas mexicana TaxID=128785 RepID=A0A7G9TD63_PSEMX|nr:hypothetical protein [Pseudoxanthomonas mexicana]QNN78038.1 hypothetical protein IAE60_00910 [Pseudoxanthomonas mexicana]